MNFAVRCRSRLGLAAPAVCRLPRRRPATNDLSDAEIQGRQLAQQLILEQRPATNFTQTGVLKIRDAKGQRTEFPDAVPNHCRGNRRHVELVEAITQTTRLPIRLASD